MSKQNKTDRRRFLSTSAKVVAGATAVGSLPSEFYAAQSESGLAAPGMASAQPVTHEAKEQDRGPQTIAEGTRDLSASVQQSSADKVLRSVSYPFCIFEQSWPFNGRAVDSNAYYDYTETEMARLLKDAQESASAEIASREQSLEMQLQADILRAGSEVIESAKRCYDASRQAGYTGPKPADVKKIVDEGVKGLLGTTRGIKFKAHLAWLKVCVADQPTVRLGNPRIAINGLHIRASATGELWWYHPTFHCSWLCLNWSVTWSWDRITDITVNNVRIAADAHADTSTAGSLVNVRGSFDRLRLDYPVLRNIPLEGVANQQLGDKLVRVFDASQFVASIPVMNTKFRIDRVELPPAANEIAIDLTVRQI